MDFGLVRSVGRRNERPERMPPGELTERQGDELLPAHHRAKLAA